MTHQPHTIPHTIAVLTGDLVNSTGLGPDKVERAFASLRECAETQSSWMETSLHFTRHRGDGWQVVLAEPKFALRSALAFRTALRANGEEFDSYIGIAEGQVKGEIGPDLNRETAMVFTHSGVALEDVKRGKSPVRMGFWRRDLTEAIAVLLDFIYSGWTPVQAEAMLRILMLTKKGRFLSDIAEELGKSRQAVTKSLKSAGYDQVREALALLETGQEDPND